MINLLKNPKFVGATVLAVALGAGYAVAAQPHMNNALSDLRAARHQLQEAVPDKGGHREAALRLIDQAIAQVNDGVHFANVH